MSYASKTKVPVERSKTEIERTLARYGAEQFAYGATAKEAVIMFNMKGKGVRFNLSMASAASLKSQQAFEQEVRRLWRSLALVIKAKLESVESGIETFEEAFMARLVLPGGRTAGQELLPKIERAYQDGKVGPLALAWEEKK
jgi:hypothetical protein